MSTSIRGAAIIEGGKHGFAVVMTCKNGRRVIASREFSAPAIWWVRSEAVKFARELRPHVGRCSVVEVVINASTGGAR